MKALIVAGLLALTPVPVLAEDVQIAGADIVAGLAPQIEIEQLDPGERVRVHTVRMFEVWESGPENVWRPIRKPLHAWADFRADTEGRVRLWQTAPIAGTFSGTDPYGILWSGRPLVSHADDPFLPAQFDLASVPAGEGVVLVTRNGDIVARTRLTFGNPENLIVQQVAQGRLNGAYAAPADGESHPALILLHGSEGGDRAAAEALAQRFAAHGYAAFAFNYFAWDLSNIEGIPNAHVNQPIEMLTSVREWLAARPEADVTRLGVYGHSKGAEYAEVAAVRLPWIDAVAACVPTDVVWQGYGVGDERNRKTSDAEPPEQYSSFSWNGRPLPYIPLDGDRSGFHTNTGFYEAKRAELGAGAQEAEIPVEAANASFLWLGGGRDEVWASGDMARKLDARMRLAGRGSQSELHVYDGAGHGICGDGTYPTRVWRSDSSDPRDPDLDATGRATIDAWARILAFFARTLK
ncbi:acyl-CoA thioester hydrolase/BAAT C-terminal domain-containing protein [Erythrobacter sp. JK5]|uniref:acyl-CoA thioester hydrolase/BAAT C-terminal domain-containing protein n=1 Tax=Erythrobacter sp. JK5 TaxID=2829500 RepID=UPI001BA63AD7|nr:acyl-CoA thioester hydrolase/BAAT C-terminal domain-containing protein [Erythrobacter sp. JK5]QUL36747.1 acyl-CoA thioesterase/BAAT N-terminal domain-containing protein [Erythrobacter sp. JK5]